MTASLRPFKPASATAVASLSVTSTSSRVQLAGAGEQCWIVNDGPNNCRIRFGTSSVTALTTDQIVLANSERIITLPDNFGNYVAAITVNSGDTTALTFTMGAGG